MFENAKVGDRIYCYPTGELVTIKSINKKSRFPLILSNGSAINYKGCQFDEDVNPTYFWDKVYITPPSPPKRKVKKEINGWIGITEFNDSGYIPFLKDEHRLKIDSSFEPIPATLIFEVEE